MSIGQLGGGASAAEREVQELLLQIRGSGAADTGLGQFASGFVEQVQAALALGNSQRPKLRKLLGFLKRLEDPLLLEEPHQVAQARDQPEATVERELASVYAGAGLAAGVSLAPVTGGASVAASLGLASCMMLVA